MATTVADPLIGRLVDSRYEITARIARGGMATVYRALDRRLDRIVALKVMHAHLAEGADVAARFRREARAAARLAHPGVVGVFDQGSADDLNYLTMEFVDGTNLRTVLRRRGALPVGEALRLIEHVLSALAAAHHAGLVHRDVKPENILVAHTGEVKVADFGLARAVSEATAASTGSLLGTVAYLSPEIVTSGNADARADIYAVGAMLFEMLTGHQPFRGETPIQVAYQHVHDVVPAPSESVPWLPFEVDELVLRMTARDPADRPADAGAALALLQRTRDGLQTHQLGIRADVNGTEGDTQTPMVTATVPAADDVVTEDSDATGTTTGLDHTGTVALPIGAVASAPAEPAQRRRVRRRRRAGIAVVILLLIATLGGGGWWYVNVGPGAYAEVPDVAGAEEADALATLESGGFVPVTTAEHSDDVPAGAVISTDPAAGADLLRGGEITVVVSRGVQMLAVPRVAGLQEGAAIEAIENEGFTVAPTVEQSYSQDVEAGVVISSDPEEGTETRHDTPVTLTVSQGREPITIPDVVGADEDTAISDLQEAGAEPQIDGSAYHDSVPEGHVLTQSPESGDALRGDIVMLTISLGPELVEVPDVFGEQYQDAEAALEALGLTVARENVFGGVFGTVRSQSVPAGDEVPLGTEIVLSVV
ncbi:Stk1 family PASTA domain-containing Ser/Thr kinase [Ruania halotolerans]|uniref:Stk1 family PASTA domain-containing Ser/Thr kinase n=1 Tax=Ruania halotolerans TaxID=2897773 RepID=UPI001E5695E7|nr:Stk1 family PASTA domain-containing Ser/Thr kinase [Ruania halotolerans]UFU04822.1 Stk1 family PASTA domain-containing Ser/Thr kinase [Ruania halotolerans]